MNMTTAFGKRLKAARAHANLTQERLCEIVGIAQSTLASAEKKGDGSRKTVQIAAVCGVNPHWLATGDGEMLGDSPAPSANFGSYESAIDLLAKALDSMPDDQRDRFEQRMRTFIQAPDSTRARDALVNELVTLKAPSRKAA